MVDQCKHCLVRGNMEACKETECRQHENWYAQEIQADLTRTHAALVELREEVQAIADYLKDERSNKEYSVEALSNALDRAERAEKGDE